MRKDIMDNRTDLPIIQKKDPIQLRTYILEVNLKREEEGGWFAEIKA